jgi:hypothetical protein
MKVFTSRVVTPPLYNRISSPITGIAAVLYRGAFTNPN